MGWVTKWTILPSFQLAGKEQRRTCFTWSTQHQQSTYRSIRAKWFSISSLRCSSSGLLNFFLSSAGRGCDGMPRWLVLLIQPVILNFLPSSTTVWYVVSDSQAESFQKIPGEKFELGHGLTRAVKIPKIIWKSTYLHVWGTENPLGSCAARNV